MNTIEMSYKDLCGVVLELIHQLQILNRVVKNDAENIRRLYKNDIPLLLENHHFHLEDVTVGYLQKIDRIMNNSLK